MSLLPHALRQCHNSKEGIMKATRLMAFAIAALITGLLSGAAQAQIGPPTPIDQTGPVITIQGLEISAGTQEVGETYGWICFGKASGDMAGNFTLSMDIASFKNPGTRSLVTHGGWTLPVYAQTIRGATYLGALYGTVESGEVAWDKAGTTASMELRLVITGGTDSMRDLSGAAVLLATVTYAEKGAGAFNGTLFLEFK
jgi:hypothetical protein